MESKNHGRDETCPAENGTAAGGSPWSVAGREKRSAKKGHGRIEVIRQILQRLPRVQAGGIFPAVMNIALSDRLVKKIDRCARKVSRGDPRRYPL